MDGVVVSILKTLLGLAIIAALMVGFNFAVEAIGGLFNGNHTIDATHLISWREFVMGVLLFMFGGYASKVKAKKNA